MKRRLAESFLLIGGAFLLIKGSWNVASYNTFQKHPDWFVNQASLIPANNVGAGEILPIARHVSNALGDLANVHVLGKLEVPRLGLSVLVVEGADEKKLGLAAGHLPDTAALGDEGNAVVAGHRDTTFWPLRKTKVGDRVRVRTTKTFDYVVTSVRVVNPDDMSVLTSSSDKHILTIVTCYPFRYFGSAPKRFIVQAELPRT